MKTTRGRLSLLLLLAVALSALAGCHGAGVQKAYRAPAEFDTNTAYELTFWAKNDTNIAQTRIYEKAIDDFEDLYPNITVTLRLYTDYGRIYNDVITNIPTKTTPNVCVTYPDHIATYLTGGDCVVALDELFADPKYGLGGSALSFDSPTREEIVPQFLDECALNGRHYAIPFMRSTEACYVNKTLVEALGYTLPETLTWDFVWEVSEAALQKDAEGLYSLNGQKILIPFIYKSTDNMMIQLLRQKSAGYSTSAGQIEIFNDTTRALLMDIAAHAKSGAFSTFKISSYPANFLNAGQCIFAVDSTAGATWMGANAPLSDISPDKFVEFETEVMTVPQFDPENPLMISQGPSVCVFNKDDPQEVLASWLFAQFLLTDGVQIAYAQTEGYVPVTAKARETSEYRDYLSRCGEDDDAHYDVKIKASELLIENVGNTFVTPVFNGSASLRDAAGQMIENVTKSVRRKQEVNDEYIDSLYADVRSLYRLDQGGLLAGTSSGRAELGPLPPLSKALLSALAGIWTCIGLYAAFSAAKRKGKRKR